MKIDVPCPHCKQTPVDVLELVDGSIWICSGCGYQEVSAGVDIEAHVRMLTTYDPTLAASWCQTLGLPAAMPS